MKLLFGKNHREKLNNEGFSLVELIVAIAILAIISVPILHSFVTAANTNLKARRAMYATTVAQDIFEGMKVHSTEEILRQVNYGVASVDGTLPDSTLMGLNVFNFINHSVGSADEIVIDEGKYVVASAPALTFRKLNVGTDLYEYTLEKKDEYLFAINDIAMGTTKYDAVVRLKADTYKDINPDKDYNNTYMSVLGNVDGIHSGVYVWSKDDESAAEEFENRSRLYLGLNSGYNADYFLNNHEGIKKTVKIVIDKNVSGGVSAGLTVTYTCDKAGVVNPADKDYVMTDMSLFDEYGDEDELCSIYIFYEPLYLVGRDTFEIYNNIDYPVNVYIVKLNDNLLVSGYTANINLHEAGNIDGVDVTNVSSSFTKIRTNLLDLSDALESKPFTYVGPATNGARSAYQTLSGASRYNQIYDVTIEIYESPRNAGGERYLNHVTTFTGSKTE